MSTVSQNTQTEETPLTRCTNCHTVFEVSADLLASTDTRVRCGECLCIFDAMDGLRGVDEKNDTLGEQWLDDTHNTGLLTDSGDLSAAHEALAGDVDNLAAEQANAALLANGADDTSLAASTLENAGAAALAGLSNDTQALDVTYSDFDLFSADADLPEIAYFDQTRNTPEFNFDSVELDEDETFSDTLFANDVTINADLPIGDKPQQSAVVADAKPADVDFIADKTPKEPLIFNYGAAAANTSDATSAESGSASITDRVASGRLGSDAEQTPVKNANDSAASVQESLEPTNSGSSWAVGLLMGFLVLSLLAGLYLYRERNRFYTHPVLGPVVAKFCSPGECSQVSRSHANLFSYNWRMYSHPTKEGVLVLSGPMRNDSDRELTFPDLKIKFQNRVGRLVRELNLSPSDYYNEWDASATLFSGKHIDITLEVNDPNHLIYAFEVM